MIASVRHSLASLARFSGRDTRGRFWPYALAVFVVVMIGGMMAAMLPVMARVGQIALAHPDQTTITTGPGSYEISIHGRHPELDSAFAGMERGVAIVAALSVLLLAAAVARRLHDRGRSGLWGLLPLPFLALSFVLMPITFTAAEPDPRMFLPALLNNLLYLASLVALVVMLAGEGMKGANRFGPDPGGAAG